MSIIETLFSGNYIDRRAELRTDPDALREAFADPQTRFIAIWKQLCLSSVTGPVMLSRRDLTDYSITADTATFLGFLSDRYLFSVRLDDEVEPDLAPEGSFNNLRELSAMLDDDALGLLAYARAMLIWQQRHRFCGVCGHSNEQTEGGFVLVCANADCGHKVFPRLDPAIIVLVHDGARCLLGRQASWPVGRFSTIAGFVEPGESLEDAVRREVREETNVEVGECRYMASQPWPFPSSLMIGYHAIATSEHIKLNDKELAQARWVSRDDIVAGDVILPPPMSVAYRLIEAWFDEGGGPKLASLSIHAPPFSVSRGGK